MSVCTGRHRRACCAQTDKLTAVRAALATTANIILMAKARRAASLECYRR